MAIVETVLNLNFAFFFEKIEYYILNVEFSNFDFFSILILGTFSFCDFLTIESFCV